MAMLHSCTDSEADRDKKKPKMNHGKRLRYLQKVWCLVRLECSLLRMYSLTRVLSQSPLIHCQKAIAIPPLPNSYVVYLSLIIGNLEIKSKSMRIDRFWSSLTRHQHSLRFYLYCFVLLIILSIKYPFDP